MSEAPQKRRFQFSIMVLLLATTMVGVGIGIIRWSFVASVQGNAPLTAILTAILIFLGGLLILATPFVVIGYGLNRRQGIKNALVWYMLSIMIALLASVLAFFIFVMVVGWPFY